MTGRAWRHVIAAVAAAGVVHAAGAQELTVERRLIDDWKAIFGIVTSVDTAQARVRIGGTVAELAVDEGSAVAAGDVLATVDDPRLGLQLAALDARIAAADAQRALALTELERVRALRASGSASQARLDEAQTAYSVAEGQLAAARAERAVVQEQVEQGAVLAPTAGRVLEVRVTAGSVVMPGEVVALIASDTFVLRLELPERHARFIQVGDGVLVAERGLQAFAAGEAGLREGRIRQVYPQLDAGRVVADAEVAGLGDYFVGERARIFVSAGAREAIVVPAEYLYRRFGVTFVRLADGRELVVQPGLPAEGGIEVLGGLDAGDVIVPPLPAN